MGQPPAGYEPPQYLPPAADPYPAAVDVPPYQPMPQSTPAWTNPTPAPNQAPAPLWVPPPAPRRSGRLPFWVLVGLAAIVAAALSGGAALFLTHRDRPAACCPPSQTSTAPGLRPGQPASAGAATPTTPAPGSSPAVDPALARQQAIALDNLLSTTKASRGRLGDALNNIDQCQDLAGAAALADQVAAERQSEIGQVQALSLNALTDSRGQPAGENLRNLLIQALTVSIQADRGYAAWARALTGNCAAPAAHDANWQGADAASQQATQVKVAFLSVWNQVALAYGLPIRPDTDI
jgi:hypothetical protein